MARDFSTYVITDPCIDVKDATCVEVCPVDCIETTSESDQYFIDPDLCIACEQCVLVCPVEAIYLEHEVPEQWNAAIERNAAFYRRIHDESPLVSTEQARRFIDKAEAHASALNLSIAIAVVDRKGQLIASGRTGDPDVTQIAHAVDKAYGAAMLERSSSALTERIADSANKEIDRSRVVLEAGGIPFGRPYITGAIAVSGATPEQNHECSRAGLTPD